MISNPCYNGETYQPTTNHILDRAGKKPKLQPCFNMVVMEVDIAVHLDEILYDVKFMPRFLSQIVFSALFKASLSNSISARLFSKAPFFIH